MNNLKKPEILVGLINAACLMGSSIYFYRRINGLEVKSAQFSTHLTEAIKKIKELANVKKQVQFLANELKNTNNFASMQNQDINSLKELVRYQSSQIAELQTALLAIKPEESKTEIKIRDNSHISAILSRLQNSNMNLNRNALPAPVLQPQIQPQQPQLIQPQQTQQSVNTGYPPAVYAQPRNNYMNPNNGGNNGGFMNPNGGNNGNNGIFMNPNNGGNNFMNPNNNAGNNYMNPNNGGNNGNGGNNYMNPNNGGNIGNNVNAGNNFMNPNGNGDFFGFPPQMSGDDDDEEAAIAAVRGARQQKDGQFDFFS